MPSQLKDLNNLKVKSENQLQILINKKRLNNKYKRPKKEQQKNKNN